ncbi:WD repeat-containing protein 18 [Rhizophlyctis rosea]|uniref:WD repeat-containing protein 18 n=1 Tax=Rhizophlyctis rosea TaxID=64517 RepID=A0AAD5X882_9FUNG|nr:WD repeat-containing protein 18 [Rhizophlyctis rosea]
MVLWQASSALEEGTQIATGSLVRMFDAHYKAVTSIQFTSDDAIMVTGGEDSAVNVWVLATALATANPTPTKSLFHSLPASAIHLSITPSRTSRTYTSSTDRTLKVFSTLSGTLLSTILFPKPLTSLIIDPTETVAYAGASDGSIYVVRLYKVDESEIKGLREGVIESAEERGTVWSGHTGAVNSLSLSFDGGILISGGEDGVGGVWDTGSGVRIRTFEEHKAPITSTNIILRPPYLLDATHPHASPTFAPFKRYQTSIGSRSDDPTSELSTPIPIQAFPSQHILSSSSLEARQNTKTDVDSKIDQLIAENRKLEQRNAMLRKMNDELYEAVVDGVVGGVNGVGKGKGKGGGDGS